MNISIAMCTYNGERYLRAQLDSLEIQNLTPYEIVIIDDCSNDGTKEILENFKKSSKLKVRLFFNEKNLGVVRAFEKAISLCEGDYISLCDQDDVWLSEKLELFSKKMKESEDKYGKDIPLMVYSDLKIVDSHLNIISPSMFKYYGRKQIEGNPLNSIFLQNIVTGCASMFNIPLKNIALPFGPNTFVHDWWLALIACGFGKIVPISQSTIHYRQHGNNSIGAIKGSFYNRFKKIFKVGQINENLTKILFQTRDFLSIAKSSDLKQVVETLDKGGIPSIFFCIKKNIFPTNIVNRLRFFQCLLFRPLLKSFKYNSFKLKNSPRPFKRIFNFLKQKLLYILPISPKPFEKVKIFENYNLPNNRKSKTLVLFAHYSTKSNFDQSLKFYIKELAKLGADIAFCSTMRTAISEGDLKFLREHCFLIIRKENIGLDFGSWDSLYKRIEVPLKYDRIILANDSVVGPFYPLKPLLDKFTDLNLDYAGLSSSHQLKNHYQSYFLIFGKNLINSKLWKDFWENFKYFHSKERIIKEYEVGFSNLILNSGFKCKAFWDYDFVHDALSLEKGIQYNPAHDLGLPLYEKLQFPFIKKNLCPDNLKNCLSDLNL